MVNIINSPIVLNLEVLLSFSIIRYRIVLMFQFIIYPFHVTKWSYLEKKNDFGSGVRNIQQMSR